MKTPQTPQPISPQPISPQQARSLVSEGAVLIDVREPDEHARERIAGAVCLPLSSWDASRIGDGPVVFHCRSGARTAMHAERLAAKTAGATSYVVEGGLDAWKKAGLPVETDRRKPLELQRQVQLAAGSMAAVGTLLGATLSPWFLVVPGLIGAGLAVAGLTGFCGLAKVLMKAPWNRGAFARPA